MLITSQQGLAALPPGQPRVPDKTAKLPTTDYSVPQKSEGGILLPPSSSFRDRLPKSPFLQPPLSLSSWGFAPGLVIVGEDKYKRQFLNSCLQELPQKTHVCTATRTHSPASLPPSLPSLQTPSTQAAGCPEPAPFSLLCHPFPGRTFLSLQETRWEPTLVGLSTFTAFTRR